MNKLFFFVKLTFVLSLYLSYLADFSRATESLVPNLDVLKRIAPVSDEIYKYKVSTKGSHTEGNLFCEKYKYGEREKTLMTIQAHIVYDPMAEIVYESNGVIKSARRDKVASGILTITDFGDLNQINVKKFALNKGGKVEQKAVLASGTGTTLSLDGVDSTDGQKIGLSLDYSSHHGDWGFPDGYQQYYLEQRFGDSRPVNSDGTYSDGTSFSCRYSDIYVPDLIRVPRFNSSTVQCDIIDESELLKSVSVEVTKAMFASVESKVLDGETLTEFEQHSNINEIKYIYKDGSQKTLPNTIGMFHAASLIDSQGLHAVFNLGNQGQLDIFGPADASGTLATTISADGRKMSAKCKVK